MEEEGLVLHTAAEYKSPRPHADAPNAPNIDSDCDKHNNNNNSAAKMQSLSEEQFMAEMNKIDETLAYIEHQEVIKPITTQQPEMVSPGSVEGSSPPPPYPADNQIVPNMIVDLDRQRAYQQQYEAQYGAYHNHHLLQQQQHYRMQRPDSSSTAGSISPSWQSEQEASNYIQLQSRQQLHEAQMQQQQQMIELRQRQQQRLQEEQLRYQYLQARQLMEQGYVHPQYPQYHHLPPYQHQQYDYGLQYNNGYNPTVSPNGDYPGSPQQQQQQQQQPRKGSKAPSIISTDTSSPTKKRARTAYTSHQLVELERKYADCKYVSRNQRLAVANELCLSERQVKIWFQNRRMKEKKERCKKDFNNEAEASSASSTSGVWSGSGSPASSASVSPKSEGSGTPRTRVSSARRENQSIVSRLLSHSPQHQAARIMKSSAVEEPQQPQPQHIKNEEEDQQEEEEDRTNISDFYASFKGQGQPKEQVETVKNEEHAHDISQLIPSIKPLWYCM